MTGSVPTVPLTVKAPVEPMSVSNSSALVPGGAPASIDWLNSWSWSSLWSGFSIQEPFTGAWQRNMDARIDSVLTYYAVYACINLIAGDIGKLTLRLVKKVKENVYVEVEPPEGVAYLPVLRLQNRYQTRQQFMESWMVSKLTAGNTYVLKERNEANIVEALHVLHPALVRPMISELDGSIWYQLGTDYLAGTGLIENTQIENNRNILVPESEIIHDRFPPLGGHRLCGVPPITACAMAAIQGINIQLSSQKLFANGAKPSGILTTPGFIKAETAKRYKDEWETNYSGNNIGKVAVLGDGLKYEPIMMSASDAQLISQLKMTAEMVCTAFGVPPHKISIGQMPNYNNIEALDQNYYSGCLQKLIEAIEACLDKGLGLEKTGNPYQTEMNIKDLLKMDTPTKIRTYSEAVKGILTTNEVREELGYDEVKGGNAVLTQQQNYSIEAIAKRDAKDDPFASGKTPAQIKPPAPAPQDTLPQPEPQKMLPSPQADWTVEDVLKGYRDAAA